MTLYTNTSGENRFDTPEELLRRRREIKRDRRMREGSRIIGQIADDPSSRIIALYPALRLAQ